jgi:hypothetical protein
VSAEIGHVHAWGAKRFIDHCHYVAVEQTCKDCGHTRAVISDRNFDLNPLQIAYARQDCAHCRVLAKGHEPASWHVTTT